MGIREVRELLVPVSTRLELMNPVKVLLVISGLIVRLVLNLLS